MTSNLIKLIACISMLVDHIALELLGNPDCLRAAGRIAMPLFAYFIGEGCRYTKNRSGYFLRIFSLGIFCQGIYAVVLLLGGSFTRLHLNILITFSVAILLSFAFLRFEEKQKYSPAVLILAIVIVILFDLFCKKSRSLVGISVTYDYGIFGVVLPLVSAMFTDKRARLIAFSAVLAVFAIYNAQSVWYYVFALVSLPIIFMYNGKRGNARFKYFFYIFYPLHLAAIYIIKLVIA